MSSNLASCKADLLAALGDVYDESGLSDGLLEQGLRSGLSLFRRACLPREASFTLLEAGFEHNVSTLNAYEILAFGYPWEDGLRLGDVSHSFRMVSPTLIRLDDLELAIGSIVRLRYRLRHAIAGLDGAATTTLSDDETEWVVLASAGFALGLLAVRRAHDPEGEGFLRVLSELAEVFFARFWENVGTGGASYLEWGKLGL